MRILLTGSSGFIGGHLKNAMAKMPFDSKDPVRVFGVSRESGIYPYDVDLSERVDTHNWFTEVNCDLTQEGRVASLMLRLQPDVVFHLAGNPLIKEWGPETSVSNYLSTHHLLSHAKRGCRFVLASSCAVYGDPRPFQVFNENDPLYPTSAYGAAKAGAEHLVRAHTAAGLVSGVVLRYAATVGVGARHGLVPDLVKKLCSPSPELELIGDEPGSRKPYTHVSDVAAATLRIGFGKAKGALNVCLEDTLSVADAAEAVMAAVGIRKPVRWLGKEANWTGDNPLVQVDSECTHLLGWNPKYPTSRLAVERAAKDILEHGKKVAA